VILLGLLCFALSTPSFTKKNVELLKKIAPFKVADYEENKFRDWTEEEFKGMLGGKVLGDEFVPKDVNINLSGRKFNFYEKNEECLLHVKNQGECGSCWAFASTTVLETRFCTHSGAKNKPILSPQELVSCCDTDYAFGCDGGDPSWVFRYYMKDTGVVTEDCFPYTAGNKIVEKCTTKCKNGSKKIYYKGKGAHRISGVQQMMDEIDKFGPIYASLTVYADFELYRGGIYQHTWGKKEGGHAIVLYGYGSENGINYWMGQNSWDTDWGEDGLFRIKFGECEIERYTWSTDPLL
jgi:cathepsin B